MVTTNTPSPTTAVTVTTSATRRALLPFVAVVLVSVSAISVHQNHHHHHQLYFSRRRRYFTGQVLLPPLERLAESFQNPPQQQQGHQSCCHDNPNSNAAGLETIYTNDPAQVYQWLANHVPSTGCALGFDLEVCFYYVFRIGMPPSSCGGLVIFVAVCCLSVCLLMSCEDTIS